MTALNKLSFEDALAELEQIVRDLETGRMKLKDAIAAYERGAALRRHCESRLGEAEMRVKAIVQNADGAIHHEDMTPSTATQTREESSQ
ncbi:exodeoxyribonuclease VII small subunit [Saccharibacter sp. 17.LH.SD]|uniref:exodeoxyribonuclease VII small subunit n=1 Tax=Saccharibacter sp. 17.LH.SD TaxID=2689393 RepID=UPI00136F0EDF|nr:exodeoxyribonuclease VII small subunit [Saccharibacter sp. 17.LH.SD]MXV43649.1 exodeoxyribonuclease VII small subunit [Saccharibacter sp. 17.LH.SD]